MMEDEIKAPQHQTFLTGQIARQLDYYRIRETIAALASSEEGKAQLLLREPIDDEKEIELLRTLGREWNTCLHSSRPVTLSPWPPVAQLLPVLAIEGASLHLDQVFALGLFTLSVRKAQDTLTSASLELPIPELAKLAATLPSLQNSEHEIFSIIDTSGELKDLPALRAIRAKIASLHKEIENAIRKYTSDSSLNSVLQSNVPAYRADRQVLAVRADKRSQIKGIVHEVSASGATVYIEPDEVVRANNELIQAEYELEAETRRILQELTAQLGADKPALEQALSVMLRLDTTYAAARYQSEIHGVFAETCNRSLEPPAIFQARHPLLGEKAVPVDIRFLDGKRVLVITGPNTGGKTVTLKTIALFAFLNQAGFPVPAAEGTRLPVFSGVFADIGDEQSIDESLSTFSSHMKNIAYLLENADENSLVLLDELGSGTDPQEGGAIAMAVLDTLIKKNAFVLVTTHHGVLKNFGWTHPSCINASVEFDNTTLAPTYRLLMGVPGESHAIDIAKRSGLPAPVVEQARSYLTTEQADVSALIKGLTAKHAELDELLQHEKEASAEIAEKSFKLQEREIALKERDVELKEMEHRKSTAFLEETRSKLENLVRILREGEITREKTLSVKQFISELTGQVDEQEDALRSEQEQLEKDRENAEKEEARLAENGIRITRARSHATSSKKGAKKHTSAKEAFAAAVPIAVAQGNQKQRSKKSSADEAQPPVLTFTPGAAVLAGPSRRNGTLLHEVKPGTWSVQLGSLKMNFPQTQLMLVPSKKQFGSPSVIIETEEQTSGSETDKPQFELRLLGLRYEEAMKALERQLDLCAVHNFRSFSIIHGKGSGILQQAVHDYLSHYPGVKEFHFAPPEEGGTGKTYVTLF
jgi:DNA mismatch repair protein MutS2